MPKLTCSTVEGFTREASLKDSSVFQFSSLYVQLRAPDQFLPSISPIMQSKGSPVTPPGVILVSAEMHRHALPLAEP